ncbi:hypothetical protein H8U31_001362 [Salmonella enterica]|nr:hypothetical protein [Salmonella enterica]
MKKSIIAVTIIAALAGVSAAHADQDSAIFQAINDKIAQPVNSEASYLADINNEAKRAGLHFDNLDQVRAFHESDGKVVPVAVPSNPTITTQQEAYRHVDRFAMRPVTADSTSAQLAHNPLYAGREVGNNAQIAVRADALRTLGQTGNEVAPHPISIAPLSQQKLESQRVANRVADDEQAFQAQIDSQPAKPAYAPTPTSLKTNLQNAQTMYARIADKTSPAAVKLESTIRSIYGQMQTLNAQLAANEHISTGDEVTRHDVRMLSVPKTVAADQNISTGDEATRHDVRMLSVVDKSAPVVHAAPVSAPAANLTPAQTFAAIQAKTVYDQVQDQNAAQVLTEHDARITAAQKSADDAQHDADEAYSMAQGLTKDIVDTQAQVATAQGTADQARSLAISAGASGAKNTQDININKDAIAQETTDRTNAVAGVQTQVTDNKTAIDGQTTRIDDNAAAIAINASGIKLNSNTLGLLNQDIKDAGVNIQTNKDAIATKVDTTTYDAGQKAQDQAISDVDGKADANKAEIATNKAEQANTDQSQNKNLLLVAGRVDQNTVWIRDNAAAQALVDGNQDKATADNTQEINTNAGNIATNKTAAATNAGNIATNKTAIATNTSSIVTLQSGVKQAQDTGAYAQSRADAAFQHAEDNKAALAATNKTVSSHTAELANHESRIQDLEAKNSANFGKLKNEVDQNRKRASAGIAGVAAMANIPQVIQGQTFSIGAGVGNTDGESALAVGMSARASEHVVVKTSVSSDTQHNFVVGAGVSYGW